MTNEAKTEVQDFLARFPGALYALFYPDPAREPGTEVGIRCLVCGMVSYNPGDVKNRYCGECRAFHPAPSTLRPLEPSECPATWSVFRDIVRAGERLKEMHTGYETAPPYPLVEEWADGAMNVPPAQRYYVEKMRLSPDKTRLYVNQYLTLTGIPAEAHEYQLGSRSALGWVIDQYRVRRESKTRDEVSDPNRADDPGYIVSLVKRVVHVSLDTVRIIAEMPTGLFFEGVGTGAGEGKPK